ncbi:MAG: hypothetical protein EA374_00585 [Acholeplasmatales bacterium]|nr:MAG: hypothetical protein EA374_00585 [Acholeplasmatales bacterium]
MSLFKELKSVVSKQAINALFSRYPFLRWVWWIGVGVVIVFAILITMLFSKNPPNLSPLAMEYLPHAYERLLEEDDVDAIASTKWMCMEHIARDRMVTRECAFFIEYTLSHQVTDQFAVVTVNDRPDEATLEVVFRTVETATDLDHAYEDLYARYNDYFDMRLTRVFSIGNGRFSQESIEEVLSKIQSAHD